MNLKTIRTTPAADLGFGDIIRLGKTKHSVDIATVTAGVVTVEFESDRDGYEPHEPLTLTRHEMLDVYVYTD